jgi:ABC-type nitrate/sulfonate/bicarbonate transport system substrate-binding protein
VAGPIDRRRFLRTSLGGAALLGVGIPFLAACGDDDDDATATTSAGAATAGSGAAADLGTANVQLDWVKNTEFAGSWCADSEGYYASEGYSSVNFLAGGPTV